jgi:hypothetical protein
MDKNEEVLMSMLLDMADDLPLYMKKWVVDKLYPVIRNNSELYVVDQYGLFDPTKVTEMVDPVLDSLALVHDVVEPEKIHELLKMDVHETIITISDYIERILLKYNDLPLDDD